MDSGLPYSGECNVCRYVRDQKKDLRKRTLIDDIREYIIEANCSITYNLNSSIHVLSRGSQPSNDYGLDQHKNTATTRRHRCMQ